MGAEQEQAQEPADTAVIEATAGEERDAIVAGERIYGDPVAGVALVARLRQREAEPVGGDVSGEESEALPAFWWKESSSRLNGMRVQV